LGEGLPYARTHVLSRPFRRSKEATSFDNIKTESKPATGTSRLYIEERLKRDHPKVWKDYFGAPNLFLAGVVYTWERLFSTFNDVLSLSKSVEIPGKKPDLQGFERWRLSLMKPLL
jgi:hypothetical protein